MTTSIANENTSFLDRHASLAMTEEKWRHLEERMLRGNLEILKCFSL